MMKSIRWISALLACAVVAASAQEVGQDCIAREQQAGQMMTQAEALAGQKAWEASLAQYDAALQIYRSCRNAFNSAVALMGVASAHSQMENYRAGSATLDEALFAIAGRNLTELEAKIYFNQAWAFYNLKEHDRALTAFAAAKERFRRMPDELSEAQCLYGAGLSHRAREEYEPAIIALQAARKIFEARGEAEDAALCDYYIGLSRYSQEQYQESIPSLQKAAGRFQALQQSENEADCLRFWAAAEYQLDSVQVALRLYQRARSLYPPSAVLDLAYCWKGEGHCYYDLDADESALASFLQAVPLFRQLDNQERVAECQAGAGSAYMALGRYEEALAVYEEAARLYQPLDLPKEEARARKNRSRIFYALDRYEAAFREAETAKRLNERGDEPYEAALCLKLMAQARLELKEFETARQYFNEAAMRFRSLNKPEDELACLKGLADSYFKQERYAEAAEHYQRLAPRYAQIADRAGEATALDYAGRSFFFQQKFYEALEMFRQAQERYGQVPNPIGQARCYSYFGQIHTLISPPLLNQAVQEFQTALTLYRTASDSTGMASCLIKLGEAYAELRQFPLARDAALRAFNIYHARNDTSGLAESHFGLAQLLFEQKQYPAAIADYRKALALYLAAHDPVNAATSWSNLAGAYYNLAKYDSALFAYANARALYLQSNAAEKAANCDLNLGDAYLAHKPPKLLQARQSFAVAFEFFRHRRDLARLAHALAGLGNADYIEKKFFEAKSNYDEALKLHREFSAPFAEAQRHARLGDIHFELAEYEAAAERYTLALSIYQQINEFERAGFARLDLGNVHLRGLQMEKALEEYAKALRLARERDLGELACASLILTGNVLREVEQQDSARVYFEQALRLAESRKDTARMSASLTNIGAVLLSQDQDAAALDYFQRALNLKTALRDSAELYVLHLNLGNLELNAKRINEGLTSYNKALAFATATKDKLGEGRCLNNLGWAEFSRGNYLVGQRYFQDAERIFDDMVYRKGLLSVKVNQGVAYDKLEKSQEAYLAYKEAIEIVEQIRGNLGRKELLQSFAESKSSLYGRMIDLLLSVPGREQEAIDYILRSQSEGVLAVVSAMAQQSGDPALLKAVNDLNKKLKEPAPSVGGPGRNRAAEIGNTKAKLDSLFRAVMPLGTDILPLERARDFSPEDAALVTYYCSKNALYIFLVTRNNFYSARVAVSKDELVAKIRNYRDLINEDLQQRQYNARGFVITSWCAPEVQRLRQASLDLYQDLIAPIAQHLGAIKTLVIIGWQELNYLPFHALAQATSECDLEFAMQRWEIVYLPYHSIIDFVLSRSNRNRETTKRVVGLAYPGNPPLRYVEDEINNLKVRWPNADIKLRSEATEEYVLQRSRNCSMLVLAAHFSLNNVDPNRSAIMLAPSLPAYDGLLTLAEVANSKFENMDLAILSGCSTAIGGEDPGQEIVSMARAFALAGTPSVIASLWSVDDLSTKELMAVFYEDYLGNANPSKIAALRKAQLSLLENPRYRHPMFWAPFILVGVWQ